jgi:hypothetical protein
MEYITLNKLVNKYPTIGNYVANVVGSIKLNGIYAVKNFIDFKISPVNNIKLDNIQTIDNTKFQFVLGVKNKSSETTPFKYFTSPDFLKKLQESINEPNPYFILQALKKEFIVEYSLEDDINTLKDLSKLEAEDSVTVKNHIWFLENGNVDYKKLVQYIDWIVSTPKPLDTANLGVIPVSDILTKADYEIKKLKLRELPKSESAGSSGRGGGGSSDINYDEPFGGSSGGSSYDTTPSSGTSTRDTNDGSGGGSGSGRGGSSDGGSGNTSGGNTGGGLGMGDGRGPYESGFDTSSGDFNSINNLG